MGPTVTKGALLRLNRVPATPDPLHCAGLSGASPSRGQKTECMFRKSYPRRKTLIHLFMSFPKQMRPEGAKINVFKN